MIRFCRRVEGDRVGGTMELGSACGDPGKAGPWGMLRSWDEDPEVGQCQGRGDQAEVGGSGSWGR